MHMKLPQLFSLVLALLTLILMVQLSCVAGCSRTFPESKNLARHKKTCLHVQRLRQTSRDARKENGHMHALLGRLPKPVDRKHRLQVLFPDCLFNSYHTKSHSQVALASVSNVAGGFTPRQHVTSREGTKEPQSQVDTTTTDMMDIDVDAPPSIPSLTRTGRPRRNYRLPRRFDDFLPDPGSPTET